MDALHVVRPGGHGFIFSDWRQLPAATDAAQFGGWSWRSIVVWDKGRGRPIKGQFRNHLEYIIWCTNGNYDRTEDYPSTLISIPTGSHGNRVHVTEKPTDLLVELLRVVDTDSPIILDPFMGSGSTLVAARRMGMQAIGIDIEERYCKMAVERLAQGVLAL